MTNSTIAVLLTGRGNNTLKDKNVIPILGKPLLSYAAQEGKKVEDATSFFVSSENSKILEAAEECGYIPIQRPPEYAEPTSQHKDCLTHAIEIMEKEHGVVPDILVVLLANCATTKTIWIEECIQMVREDPTISAVIPVQQDNDHHPLRAKKISTEGYLEQFVNTQDNHISSNRQDLEPNYFVCHNFWVLNLTQIGPPFDNGQPPWPFMGNKIKPYVVDYSLDVHAEEDIFLTETWLKKEGGLKSW